MMVRAVIIAAVVSVAVALINPPLRLGAWNVENFGTKKMDKPGVPDILKEVIQQYDLIVIQEVKERKKGEKATTRLLNLLNSGTDTFKLLLSEEKNDQNAVYYKHSRITVEAETTISNDFIHPLYKLVLTVADEGRPYKFGMIVLHTSPKSASAEMTHLATRTIQFRDTAGLSDTGVLIAGDLNAGRPLNPQDGTEDNSYSELLMKHHKLTQGFTWLIGDNINTDSKAPINGVYPYDRLIVLGGPLNARLYGAKVYCYDRDYLPSVRTPIPQKQTNINCEPRSDDFKDRVLAVSDHYPVDVLMH